jgi:hypothetical protein
MQKELPDDPRVDQTGSSFAFSTCLQVQITELSESSFATINIVLNLFLRTNKIYVAEIVAPNYN